MSNGRNVRIVNATVISRGLFICNLVLARLGIPKCQYNVGKAYLNGSGVLQSDDFAVFWCRKAASNGYAPAEYMLANFHIEKSIEPSALTLAFNLFARAAQSGYQPAQHALAWCYEQGVGTGINKEEAFRLWLECAEKGFPNSQWAVANCLFVGSGVKQDFFTARQWCQRAISNGADDGAKQLLKQLDDALRLKL